MGTFQARIRNLEREVGDGELEGRVVVDQVYAEYQHEGLEFRHPGGGQAKYLEQPLFSNHRDYLQDLADQVLNGDLNQTMADQMESLSREVYRLAPIEFADLKASGNPQVFSQGQEVYNRPALVQRLTDEEIDIKRQLRSLGLGNVPAADGFGGLD